MLHQFHSISCDFHLPTPQKAGHGADGLGPTSDLSHFTGGRDKLIIYYGASQFSDPKMSVKLDMAHTYNPRTQKG